MKHARGHRRAGAGRPRRAFVLGAVVIVLATAGLLGVGAIAASAEQSRAALSRVDTVRAFFAAESATALVVSAYIRVVPVPGAGESLEMDNATAVVVQAPEDPADDLVIVEGRSASARRRVAITLE